MTVCAGSIGQLRQGVVPNVAGGGRGAEGQGQGGGQGESRVRRLRVRDKRRGQSLLQICRGEGGRGEYGFPATGARTRAKKKLYFGELGGLQ